MLNMDPMIAASAAKALALWAWDKIADDLIPALDKAIVEASKDVARKEIAENQRALWGKVKWNSALSAYRTNLLQIVSTTRLLGHPRPIDLSQLYTDVMVYDKESAFRFSKLRNFDTRDLQQHEDSFPRRRGVDVVSSGKHIYILGRPGAGKTTFLKHLAYLACKGEIARTPVFVAFREHHITAQSSIVDIISKEFQNCGMPPAGPFVVKLLESGRALLLFDGLDEVAEDQGKRKHLINELITLAKRFPKCQICVSCRIAATEYAFERFEYLEVADFSDEQKDAFCERWFQSDPERLHRFLTNWKAPQNSGIRELGRTPLLLAFICLAYEETLQLPHRRVDLYKDAVDALLRRWDTTRNIERDNTKISLPHYRYEPLLCELAAQNFAAGAYIFHPTRAASIISGWYEKLPEGKLLSGEEEIEILNALEYKTGLIVSRAKDAYSFSHLSIQEYLTSVAIMNGRVFRSSWTFVNTRLLDKTWREVFIFLSGMSPDATSLTTAMADECVSIIRPNSNWGTLKAALVETISDAQRTPGVNADALVADAIRRLASSQWIPSSEKLDLAAFQQTLNGIQRICTLLPREDFRELRNVLALLGRVLSASRSVTVVQRVILSLGDSFHSFIYGLGLTIECGLTGICRDRRRILEEIIFERRSSAE
ncbi:NACHT domain-containing protein [Roseateles cellulosilyticus]|uniref:NACHT domain-containing protein n=1 Tax=Pelomonas cellulosilytica TaxID=2906762 RepID=A0ABS8XZC9_9BURK|nr:NACHT domain-containing protein [Pelomonas sp. P8]MCE4557979.1 NACHT domain-containing protein [Pelomonas sp. P8]